VGEVSRAFEQLEPAAGRQLVGAPPVCERDDPVARPPHDQDRQFCGEVQPIHRLHPLPADVHAGPQRMDNAARLSASPSEA